MSYVYIQYTEKGDNNETIHWFTVGHYDGLNEFVPESDHRKVDEAAARVHWLNGGIPDYELKLISKAANYYLRSHPT